MYDIKDIMLFICSVLIIILVSVKVHAGEWNDKPVFCEQLDEFEKTMVEEKQILLAMGDIFATVRTSDGLSDIPATLPVRVYFNPGKKAFTVAEYHPDYNSVCVLAFGGNFQILGGRI
tara:strand:- start:597 stop:950 length:354 start_codon:yes stop_codon:yes gene_type:complete